MQTLFQQAALLGDVWVFWLLVAMSLLGGTVFIERWRLLRAELRSRAVSDRIVSGLREYPGSGVSVLEQILQAKLLDERRSFEQRVVILGTIGSNAPFVGLLGTVLGVIQAFYNLGIVGDGGTGVVMTGIASALVITAVGLVVAIPAVIANNYLRTLIEDLLSMAESAGRLELAVLSATESARGAQTP